MSHCKGIALMASVVAMTACAESQPDEPDPTNDAAAEVGAQSEHAASLHEVSEPDEAAADVKEPVDAEPQTEQELATLTAAGMTRVDACFNGACGSATYKRTGSNSFDPIKLSIKDNKCDGHPVYIQVGVEDHSPEPIWLNTKHYNHTGCHGGYATWSTYLIHWRAPIAELLVRVCVDDFGGDTCKIAF